MPDRHGPRGDLCAAPGAQLREDMRYVCRDRLRRQHQLLRDLPIGQAGRHQLGDLEFAFGERMPWLCRPPRIE